MADMYGAVRSNEFLVNDVDAFKKWFNENVRFGNEIQVWVDSNGKVAFGGYEQYPNAWPNKPYVENEDDDDDLQDDNAWELEEFATEVRKHLQPGEEFRVFAAGHEKLRYVSATHLIIKADSVEFNNYGEG